MISKKYKRQILCSSFPRSGNHFMVDLLRHFELRDCYLNIFHYSELLRMNRSDLSTITSIRNPYECISSLIVLQNLMNYKFLNESPYERIYGFAKDRLRDSDIIEEYVSFIEVSQETGATTILFEDLKAKPIEVLYNINNRLNLGLDITEDHIKNQYDIVKEIMARRRLAEERNGNDYIYVSNYPRDVYNKPFYKAIRQAVEENPKVLEAYALFEAFKTNYKF